MYNFVIDVMKFHKGLLCVLLVVLALTVTSVNYYRIIILVQVFALMG